MIDLMLQYLHSREGAARSLVLKADRTQSPVKVWIEHEEAGMLPSIAEHWQGRGANGRYGDLLNECSLGKTVVLVTAEMPDSVLRDLYSRDGVAQSVVMSLGHQAIESYRYLSLNFIEAADRDLEGIRAAAVTMSRMISRLDLR